LHLFRRSILACVAVVLVVSCTDIDTETERVVVGPPVRAGSAIEGLQAPATTTPDELAHMTEQLYRRQAERAYVVAAWKDAFAVHAAAAAARADARAEQERVEAASQRRAHGAEAQARTRGEASPEIQVGTGISRTAEEQAFLDFTRGHESDSAGGYQAVNPSGKYRGAYQFDQNTWDSVTSRHAPHLVGVNPADASPADQDEMATELYRERGNQPWGGRC
jgi:hypothetical protein